MTELGMPKLSDSMEQGTILTWLKQDGDEVHVGEALLEIETDKATVTHAAEVDGVLEIIAPEGTTLAIGEPIARLRSGSEAAPPPPGIESSGTESNDAERAVPTEPSVRATPLARRVARVHEVALAEVDGSGPLGRVTRRDVLEKAGVTPEPMQTGSVPSAPTPVGKVPTQLTAQSGKGEVEVVAPTRLQLLIARRMAEAKATMPHFQVQTEVAIDAAMRFRTELKASRDDAPSLNDLVVKAAALALREHPLANASYRDGRFELYSRVNVGVAVAADDALVVPTIFDADQKSLGTIAAESKQLAGRVRDGQITPAELAGATFTVSNLGMYGMTSITPVINPPQAAILGVGAMRQVLARVGNEIVDHNLMTLTLSCDHRILYGTDAARFLSTVRELLEQPVRFAL